MTVRSPPAYLRPGWAVVNCDEPHSLSRSVGRLLQSSRMLPTLAPTQPTGHVSVGSSRGCSLVAGVGGAELPPRPRAPNFLRRRDDLVAENGLHLSYGEELLSCRVPLLQELPRV